MAPARSKFDWKGFLLLCGIVVVVALLWHTDWVLPLKLLVVLLHEVSHGIAALLTGGRVVEMHLGLDEGGHCVTAGGHALTITSAGYLGSLAFGVSLLLIGARTRFGPVASALLGALLVMIAFRYMTDWRGVGRWFALVSGLLLTAVALFPRPVAGVVLRLIGVTSCLYVFLDIKHDVLDRDHAASDASRLAELTGVPAVVWGIVWCGTSIVVSGLAMTWAVSGPPPDAGDARSGGPRTDRRS